MSRTSSRSAAQTASLPQLSRANVVFLEQLLFSTALPCGRHYFSHTKWLPKITNYRDTAALNASQYKHNDPRLGLKYSSFSFCIADPPSVTIGASIRSLGFNVLKKTTTGNGGTSSTEEYSLLPNTSAIFECVAMSNLSYSVEIEWRSYVDSFQERSVMLAKVINQSSLQLNISVPGAYLCIATLRFSDCQAATSSTNMRMQVNELHYSKFLVVFFVAFCFLLHTRSTVWSGPKNG